jgi:DNA-binding beta-propeller fold protein YncE
MFKRYFTGRRVIVLALTATLLAGTAIGAAVYQKEKKRQARREAERAAAKTEWSSTPSPGTTPDLFAPRPVPLAPDCAAFPIYRPDKMARAINMTYPVNIVNREGQQFYVCNYRQLFLIDLGQQRGWEISPPEGLSSAWVPTGLFYQPATRKLYVANYTAHNVLVLDASDKAKVKLLQAISHPEMKGPEGVAVTDDGRFIAVADYDGQATFLFDSYGHKRWKHSAPSCHGVAILRTADGRRFVLSTSLAEASILKLDFDGRLVKKVANPGWQQHGYVYPTAIMTRADGLIAVTDAFRGQISYLDEDLGVYGVLGGNGPGPTLFNNPYGSCWNGGGDRLLVADTFKDRLVEISQKTRLITAVYPLVDPADRKAFTARGLVRDCELDGLAHGLDAGVLGGLVMAAPFGSSHVLVRRQDNYYVDPRETFTLPLPHFTAATGKRLGTAWHCGIHGVACAARHEANAWSIGMTGLLTDYAFRFIYARNYDHEGEKYLVLSSPQSADVLVCGRGVTIPLPLHKDSWLVGDTLVGVDYVVPMRRLVEVGAARIKAFLEQPAGMAPLEAIRAGIFPKWTRDQLRAAFVGAMRSPAGHKLAQESWAAQDAEGQRAAAQRYLAACAREDSLQLAEIFMAEMMLCQRK